MNSSHLQHPLRVLLLRVGGWENWVDTLAGFFARSGVEVHALVFVSQLKERPSASPGVRLSVEVVPSGFLRKLGVVWRAGRLLRRYLTRNDFDVLYVVDSWSIPTLSAATFGKLRSRNRGLVYHTFEWLDPTVHSSLHIRLERSLCRKADLVVNIDRMRGRLQQMLYGLSTAPLWVRTSLPRDYPVPAPSGERRRELLGKNPPADAVAILSPSIASQERLSLELIHAFSGLPDRFRLSIIAGCDDYFTSCLDVTRRLGLSDRVTFLPRMPFARVMEYVASGDLGVILHDGRESLGNFLANPMRLSMFASCGIPFIASDFPTLAGEVYRYGLGGCCNELSPDAIRRAVFEYASRTEDLVASKKRIRAAFEESLCFESRGDELLRSLNALLQKPSPSA